MPFCACFRRSATSFGAHVRSSTLTDVLGVEASPDRRIGRGGDVFEKAPPPLVRVEGPRATKSAATRAIRLPERSTNSR